MYEYDVLYCSYRYVSLCVVDTWSFVVMFVLSSYIKRSFVLFLSSRECVFCSFLILNGLALDPVGR